MSLRSIMSKETYATWSLISLIVAIPLNMFNLWLDGLVISKLASLFVPSWNVTLLTGVFISLAFLIVYPNKTPKKEDADPLMTFITSVFVNWFVVLFSWLAGYFLWLILV